MPKSTTSKRRFAEAPIHPETGEVGLHYLDLLGREVLDPNPVEELLSVRSQPTIAEQIRRAVREQLSAAAEDAGEESFEEANDFDIGDDYDPRSPYEMDLDAELEGEPSPQPAPDPASPQPEPKAPTEGGEGVAPSTDP